MSPSAQDRLCDPAGPVIEQCDAGSEAIVQVIPVRDGRVSVIVTAVAVVAAPGPLLATVIWNPTVVPESTGVASAVFVIVRLGDGIVRVVQFSPASPPVLFWSPSCVMTW